MIRNMLNVLVCLMLYAVSVVSTTIAQEKKESQSAANSAVVDADTKAILKLLRDQEAAWNRNDIEGFMVGYWQDERMSFAGGGTLLRGWNATLERYKTRYPAGKMGQLEFRNLEPRKIGEAAAMVLGTYHLQMENELAEGGFTLVLEKFDDGWKIIHDHTSPKERPANSGQTKLDGKKAKTAANKSNS